MKVFAQILSILLYPMLIPTYAIGLLCYAIQSQTGLLASAYIGVAVLSTLFLTCCVPFSIVLFLVKQGVISDIYLHNPKERRTPYVYSFCACCFWCYFLASTLHVNWCFVAMAMAATVVLLLVTIITNWWKISAHLSFFGALIGGVIGYSWYMSIFPTYLIVALLVVALLLMYARIILKQHTPAQVICGFLLGMTLTFLPVLFF